MHKFDLLSTVEYGGCSAKISPQLLDKILGNLPKFSSEKLLVGTETHDDAAVYAINEQTALIQTTDFFPPICSDPYQFGQIAAANSLSDIYAMGGQPITALNLVMFPANELDVEILEEILKGGADKCLEAGAVLAGGHSIDDYPPKYGLAVSGLVDPQKIITNAQAQIGDQLILTKPLGTGTIIAGQRIKEVSEDAYKQAIKSMSTLNKEGSDLMQKYQVKSATDVTGFSLAGHALEMAEGSQMAINIFAQQLPLLPEAYQLTELGCITGGAFRNLQHVEDKTLFSEELDYNLKMLSLDPQTSGGLLMAVKPTQAKDLLLELKKTYDDAQIIGEVVEKNETNKWLNILP